MRKTLEKMIHLARLKLPEDEINRLTKKTEHILEYIEHLKELNTDNIEPTSHAIDVVNAFREDTVKSFASPKKLVEIAPKSFENLFEVPRVIDEN